MTTPNSTVSDERPSRLAMEIAVHMEVHAALSTTTEAKAKEIDRLLEAEKFVFRSLSTGTDAGVREVWRSENHDTLLAHATPVERMQRICDSKSFNYSEIFGMAGAWYAAYSALEQQPAASQEGARNEAARMQEQGHDPRVPLTGKGA